MTPTLVHIAGGILACALPGDVCQFTSDSYGYQVDFPITEGALCEDPLSSPPNAFLFFPGQAPRVAVQVTLTAPESDLAAYLPMLGQIAASVAARPPPRD